MMDDAFDALEDIVVETAKATKKGGPRKPRAKKPSETDEAGGEKEHPITSLGELSRRFIEFMEQQEDQTCDLALVATALDVPKRRIYDITNVLEGVNLLEKMGKNNVWWKGSGGSDAIEVGRKVQADIMRQRLLALDVESATLDAATAALADEMASLQATEEYASLAYVTLAELKTLPLCGPPSGSSVLAVQAPLGSSLSIFDPTNTSTLTHAEAEVMAGSGLGGGSARTFEAVFRSDAEAPVIFPVSCIKGFIDAEPGRITDVIAAALSHERLRGDLFGGGGSPSPGTYEGGGVHSSSGGYGGGGGGGGMGASLLRGSRYLESAFKAAADPYNPIPIDVGGGEGGEGSWNSSGGASAGVSAFYDPFSSNTQSHYGFRGTGGAGRGRGSRGGRVSASRKKALRVASSGKRLGRPPGSTNAALSARRSGGEYGHDAAASAASGGVGDSQDENEDEDDLDGGGRGEGEYLYDDDEDDLEALLSGVGRAFETGPDEDGLDGDDGDDGTTEDEHGSGGPSSASGGGGGGGEDIALSFEQAGSIISSSIMQGFNEGGGGATNYSSYPAGSMPPPVNTTTVASASRRGGWGGAAKKASPTASSTGRGRGSRGGGRGSRGGRGATRAAAAGGGSGRGRGRPRGSGRGGARAVAAMTSAAFTHQLHEEEVVELGGGGGGMADLVEEADGQVFYEGAATGGVDEEEGE